MLTGGAGAGKTHIATVRGGRLLLHLGGRPCERASVIVIVTTTRAFGERPASPATQR